MTRFPLALSALCLAAGVVLFPSAPSGPVWAAGLEQPGSVPVHPHTADDSAPDNCPVCQELMARVAAARASVAAPVVTRPEPGLIIVRGAEFAGTRPYSWPIRGTPIPLADIAEPNPGDDTVWFLVRPGETYEVWASAVGADGVVVPFDFTVTPSREDLIEQFIVLSRDAQALKESLRPTFLEIVQAAIRIRAREPVTEPVTEPASEPAMVD
jgi:hypothetical protein